MYVFMIRPFRYTKIKGPSMLLSKTPTVYYRSIIFYRFPDLKSLSTVNVHKKNITCLAWYRTDDPNGNVNSLCSFFAPVLQDFPLHPS